MQREVVLLDNLSYICSVYGKTRFRTIVIYKDYFPSFFSKQRKKVKDKIIWTLSLLEELQQVPETYLKHITGTGGLYEIRIQCGNDIFRIFCFFDQEKLIITINGFQKKTQKTPGQEIIKALKIKESYYAEKKQSEKT